MDSKITDMEQSEVSSDSKEKRSVKNNAVFESKYVSTLKGIKFMPTLVDMAY